MDTTRIVETARQLWGASFMGVDVQRILLALAIAAGALVLRRPFGALVLRQIRRVFARSKVTADDAVIHALTPACRFLTIVAGAFVITEFVVVSPRTKQICVDVNRSLMAFTIFWALFEIVAPLVQRLSATTDVFSESMTGWVTRVAKIVVLVIGGAAVLEIWGIKVGAVLAGFGLVGAAVALGAQDLFKNLIAGVFIIGERRFQKSDWIRADGVVEGTVEVIGLRTTRVRQFDLSPVFVPNSKLADNPVINFSQMTHRQISWTVGLEYSTTIEQLRRIRDAIEAYIKGKKDFVASPDAPVLVRVDSFGDSAINLMVYCFTHTTTWDEWLAIKEALAYEIKSIVADAGSDFAFPSQSIYVETLPPPPAAR